MLARLEVVPNHLPPKAVILDVDGTLVDSNDANARAWLRMLEEDGRHESYERVRHMIGMGGDRMLAALTGVSDDSEAGRRMRARRREIFETAYLPYVRAFSGTRPLALLMRDAGIRVVVASSADGELLGRLLDIARVRDLVEGATSNDAAGRSKPDPDIVRAALEKTGQPAGQVLMIGDTPYDIEAAASAGVRTIALRCGGGWSEQDLAGAIAIFDDPLDLAVNYDDSPLVGRGEWDPVSVRRVRQ